MSDHKSNIPLGLSYILAVGACVPALLARMHNMEVLIFWLQYSPWIALAWLLAALFCFRQSVRTGLLALIPAVPVLYLNWVPILFLIAWPLCGHGGRCMDG